MFTRSAILAVFAVAVALTAAAETLYVDGKPYPGAKLYETDNRYYIRMPDGTSKTFRRTHGRRPAP